MKIAILAPINTSLYSRLVSYMSIQEPGIEVCHIIVRKIFNFNRLSDELKRDGTRLLNKIHKKYILREKAYEQYELSLATLADQFELTGMKLSDLGRKYNIPTSFVNDHNENKAISLLSNYDLDAIIFTGGGLIRQELLSLSKLGVINCHAGLLPHYRGMDVIEWAVLESSSTSMPTGITLHFMDKGVDTGPILKTKSIEFNHPEKLETIRDKFEPIMVDLLINGLRDLRDNKISPKTQKLTDGKQYFVMHPRIKKITEKKYLELSTTK